MTSKISSGQKLFNGWFDAKIPYDNNSYWTNLKRKSQDKAFKIFQQASQDIPAYKDFLKKNGVKSSKIKSFKGWSKIPFTTKENFVEQYSLPDRCWGGTVSTSAMISLSSGTSGKPRYWPRSLEHEIQGAILHEYIFKTIFQINKKKTLFVNGFALGNWIAGTFTLICAQLVAWKGYPITIMTPGYSLGDVLELVRDNASYFDQTIICGHTPFLKEIIDEASSENLFSKLPSIRFLGTGQSITESWRSYVLGKIGTDRYFDTFLNLYGSTDAALMGFETPSSIFLRKLVAQDGLNHDIFDDSRVPSIFNYDPLLTFFETSGNELAITKNSGSPLIKYNIKDEGGVIGSTEFQKKFSSKELSGIKKLPGGNLQLPYVYLFGREKFMVKVYGAIVYVEHAQLVIDQAELLDLITGRFSMQIEYDDKQNQTFNFHVELRPQVDDHKQVSQKIKDVFVREVPRVNKEYAFVLAQMGKRAEPNIILHAHGDEPLFPLGKIKKTA